MLKTLFSLLVGIFFAACSLGLIAIYWFIGTLARVLSFFAVPFHRLFSNR